MILINPPVIMSDQKFLPGYIKTLKDLETDSKRYEQKVEYCGGVDPYELNLKDLCADRNAWPVISVLDRFDYFVNRASFIDRKAAKCYKSVLASDFTVDNMVHPPLTKKLDSGYLLVLGRVSFGTSEIFTMSVF